MRRRDVIAFVWSEVFVSRVIALQVRRSQEAADKRRRSLAAKEMVAATDNVSLPAAAAVTAAGGAPQVITRLVHETQIEYITRITRINNEANGGAHALHLVFHRTGLFSLTLLTRNPSYSRSARCLAQIAGAALEGC